MGGVLAVMVLRLRLGELKKSIAGLDDLLLLGASVDEADASLTATVGAAWDSATQPGEHCYVEVCRSISEAALALKPYTPRSTRKDVLAFSAGNKKHVQRIF